MKQVTLLMIALVLSTGCSVIIELSHESFTFPKEYPMHQSLMQDLSMMPDSQVDLIFHKEVCRGQGQSPGYGLPETFNHIELWLGAEKASGRIWLLRIEREAGHAYIVYLDHKQLGPCISHSPELSRALKVAAIMANRTAKGQDR